MNLEVTGEINPAGERESSMMVIWEPSSRSRRNREVWRRKSDTVEKEKRRLLKRCKTCQGFNIEELLLAQQNGIHMVRPSVDFKGDQPRLIMWAIHNKIQFGLLSSHTQTD